MPAAILDVEIQRGDNDPAVIWKIVDDNGQPFMEPSSTFVLLINWRGLIIRKDSAASDGLTYDAPKATVMWTPTPAETASIPLGRLASYSLQRRAGSAHRTFVAGRVIGLGAPVP